MRGPAGTGRGGVSMAKGREGQGARKGNGVMGHRLPSPPSFVQNLLKGGPEPLEKEIHEILGSKREDRFSNPFFELVQETCQVYFRTCFGLVISVRARGLFESSRRSARRLPGVEGTLFMYTTSDRLNTWLILSRTTGSKQYHESTMV